MAYGGGNRQNMVAVNDGGSGGSKYSQLADYARQQAEAQWAAQIEAERRRKEEEAQRKAQEEAQRRANAKQRKDQQKQADIAAAQQDAQNVAWKNLVDNTSPQDLSSNGSSIWNNKTGQTYTGQTTAIPKIQQEEEPQWQQSSAGYMPYGDPRQKKKEEIVPQTPAAVTPQAQNYVSPYPQARDYTDSEISQMSRDRSNLVVPRIYNQQEQAKANGAGIGSIPESTAETYDAWKDFLEAQGAQATQNEDSMWSRVVDQGSALGGGYVAPILPGAQSVRGVTDALRGFAEGITRPDLQPDYNAIASYSRRGTPITPNLATDQYGRTTVTPNLASDTLADLRKVEPNLASDSLSDLIVPEEFTLNPPILSGNDVMAPSAADQYLEAWQRRQQSIDNALARQNAQTTAPAAEDTFSRIVDESNYGTTPERARALEVAQSMGLFGPEAVEFADKLVSSGTYNFKPNENAIKTKAENIYLDNLIEQQGDCEITEAQRAAAKAYGEEVANNYRVGTPGNQRFDARQGTGTPSSASSATSPSTPTTGGGKTTGGATPSTSNSGTTAKDPAQEVLDFYLQATGKKLEDLDEDDMWQIRSATNAIRNASSTSGTPSVSDVVESTNAKKPKGSQYFTPSYGQNMKQGVKAPYKAGGYTEDELKAMGNVAYDNNGRRAYEGYYQAPNGNWYPVDQEKAAYYLNYGTYKGWDEGMREYYNTFGTFSGYTPTWKQTGKSYGGGGYGGGYGYSRSGGGGTGYINTSQASAKKQQESHINNIMKNWSF